jgi:hypothetical protein
MLVGHSIRIRLVRLRCGIARSDRGLRRSRMIRICRLLILVVHIPIVILPASCQLH